MKTLFLVRHAKSSWEISDIPDRDRPLKDRGLKDAFRIAARLKRKRISPQLIISSPALRAISTAVIFARSLKVPLQNVKLHESAYGFGKVALLKLIQHSPARCNRLMLVGHDPALTHLLNDLAGQTLKKIPTSAVATIRFSCKTWKEIRKSKGRLVSLDLPVKTKDKPNSQQKSKKPERKKNASARGSKKAVVRNSRI